MTSVQLIVESHLKTDVDGTELQKSALVAETLVLNAFRTLQYFLLWDDNT